MTAPIGHNTPQSELLRSFVDRVEQIDAQKKALSEDRKLVLQEAKNAGFNVKQGINVVLKARKAKPHDYQEAVSIADTYLHAMGMAVEPPLFRQMQAIARDIAGSDKLLEAFKLLVPDKGFVIFKVEDKSLRLFRGKDGEPVVEPYTEPSLVENARSSRTTLPAEDESDVPNCTPDEAERLGEQAAKDNTPVIENPFPFGDERRPRWDLGWRRGSGNDGMGPK